MDRLKRDFCFALSSALASSCALAGRKDALPSKIYQFDDLLVRDAGNLIFRGILDGMISAGCHISLRESDLAPHGTAHPRQTARPRGDGVRSGRHVGVYR